MSIPESTLKKEHDKAWKEWVKESEMLKPIPTNSKVDKDNKLKIF